MTSVAKPWLAGPVAKPLQEALALVLVLVLVMVLGAVAKPPLTTLRPVLNPQLAWAVRRRQTFGLGRGATRQQPPAKPSHQALLLREARRGPHAGQRPPAEAERPQWPVALAGGQLRPPEPVVLRWLLRLQVATQQLQRAGQWPRQARLTPEPALLPAPLLAGRSAGALRASVEEAATAHLMSPALLAMAPSVSFAVEAAVEPAPEAEHLAHQHQKHQHQEHQHWHQEQK